jgi:hypothetical protein
MDSYRHKTLKKYSVENPETPSVQEETFKALLEDSAREAYSRPWHRLERGLRLNRLRIFIEDTAPEYNMTKEEKDNFFIYLQKLLDKKLLNTLKVVQYNQEQQKIQNIHGLEIKRNAEGQIRWLLTNKKVRTDMTRKKKKEETSSNNNLIKYYNI